MLGHRPGRLSSLLEEPDPLEGPVHIPIGRHVLEWCVMPTSPGEEIPSLADWLAERGYSGWKDQLKLEDKSLFQMLPIVAILAIAIAVLTVLANYLFAMRKK